MTYFMIEACGKYGDYEFMVFAENEQQARDLWTAQNESEDVEIHRVYGPNVATPGQVIQLKQPE